MKKLVKERKDLAVYIKLFPLTKIHKDSYRKAKAIQCKNSVELLELAFKHKPIADPTCETKVIDENIKLARKLGFTGTPTIVLDNGIVIRGYAPAKRIEELLDKK